MSNDELLAYWVDEFEKCKDPVYFYENYLLVNGQKPFPLTDRQKKAMREWAGDEQRASLRANLNRRTE